MSKEAKTGEKEKLRDDLSNYSDKDYKSPSVTVDIALMSVVKGKLSVLMMKRAYPPYRDSWALPGGFVDIKEGLDTAARRELEEETGLKGIFLEQLYSFGDVKRDPRKRVISVAYFALVPYTDSEKLAGEEATSYAWFEVDKLPEKLAFDHDKIIKKAVERIRGKIGYSNVGFELVPEKFTIPELREIFEQVLGRSLNPSNFRTKLLKLGILRATKKKKKMGRGQPAPYYVLDKQALAELEFGETLF